MAAACVLAAAYLLVLEPSGLVSANTPHAPLLIVGNVGFTVANGTIGGDGTPSDPFVIQDWDIDASMATGIAIADTDAHFIIRNVYVHDGGSGYHGIFLSNVTNGYVENATLRSNWNGVRISSSNSVSITNSSVSASELEGIRIWFSTSVTVKDSMSTSNIGNGISISSASNIVIDSSNVSSNFQSGVEVVSSSTGVGIIASEVSNNSWNGVYFSSSVTNITVQGNDIHSNGGTGIDLSSSTGAVVAHNNLINNSVQASDDGGSENTWDMGFPLGGNYWSDYAGVDNCSGPDQNVCPDPDGLGDTMHSIDANSGDFFPLANPYIRTNTPPTASFILAPTTGDIATAFTADASSSWDLETPTTRLEVRWDWEGDGVWDSAWSVVKVAQHQFQNPGTYAIRLQIRDVGGLTNQSLRIVLLADTPPEASFEISPLTGDTSTTFLINASSSSDLEDPAAQLELRWDWEDDGVWDTSWSTTKELRRQYTNPGSYTIRLEVRDGSGLMNTTTRLLVVADIMAPQILHDPLQNALVGQGITVTISVVDDGALGGATLYYREVGQTSFLPLNMNRMSDQTYEGRIPPQDETGFVEYYVTAVDTAGNEARSPEMGTHRIRIIDNSDTYLIGVFLILLAFAVVTIAYFLLKKKRGPGEPGRPKDETELQKTTEYGEDLHS